MRLCLKRPSIKLDRNSVSSVNSSEKAMRGLLHRLPSNQLWFSSLSAQFCCTVC